MTRVVIVGLVLAAVSAAQDSTGSWADLSLLRVGQKIEVVDEGGKRHRARFTSISGESVVLRRKGQEFSIARGKVVRVGVRAGSKRARNAAILTGVGAGVGLGLGAVLLTATGGSDGATEILAASTAIGAGVGAALGAVIPGYRTVYRHTTGSSGNPP